MSIPRPLLLALAASFPAGTAVADDDRFVGERHNRQRVSASTLVDWNNPEKSPRLGDHELLNPDHPFAWVVDQTKMAPSEPAAFVEFVGGDRLPGRVLYFHDGRESPYLQWPPHLVVEPSVDTRRDDSGPQPLIRVTTKWLRRVVWQPQTAGRLQPGTAFLKDGREMSFRSVRWTDEAVLLLGQGGLETVRFADLAEVHLPRRNVWDAYFSQLARLAANPDSLLIRCQTEDGLVATATRERYVPERRGHHQRPDDWRHVVQPAWSLDPLWIRVATVRGWRFHRPHEVPLSRIEPARVRQRSIFGSSWRWQQDRSVQNSPLASGGKPYGWGFGVHAYTELQFDLPGCARSFRSRLGLDESVGQGGCARARVFAGADLETKLYESPVLVGSQKVHDTGNLDVAKLAAADRPLVLVADPAVNDRPSGADPFDVRDAFDWLEPVLVLDREELAAEVRRRIHRHLHGFGPLALTDVDHEDLRLENHWDERNAKDPRFRSLMVADAPFVTAAGTVTIEARHRFLAVSAHRQGDEETPTRIQVRIGDRTLGEAEVPRRRDNEFPDPVLVPLQDVPRGETPVEIVLLPAKPGETRVDWRGVALVERRPQILRLFEDELDFPRRLKEGDGTATVVHEDSYTGDACLMVTPTGRAGAELPDLAALISMQPRLGEYRYVRFAWKKVGGEQIGLRLAHEGEFGSGEPGRKPRVIWWRRAERIRRRLSGSGDSRHGVKTGYRYDRGKGDPAHGASLRLHHDSPNDWKVETRDLYGDFGTFTLTGLGFDCPDGDYALFDHVCLARSPQDFELLREQDDSPPEIADPNVLAVAADPWRYHTILHDFAPGFTSSFVAHGAQRLKEHQGRSNLLQTLPHSTNRPCELRRTLSVPKEGKTQLHATVSIVHEKQPWRFVVFGNGEKLFEKTVEPKLLKDGWADLTVDLDRFRGRKVLLEVHHASIDDRRPAVWQRLVVETE